MNSFLEATFDSFGLNVLYGHPRITNQDLNIVLLYAEIYTIGQLKTMLEQATNSHLFPKQIEYLNRRLRFFEVALKRAERLRDDSYNNGEGLV